MCGGKKTCAFASLKILLVIGATHGLIEGIKKIRNVCAFNLMRLVPDYTVAAFVVRPCVLAK